VDLKNSGIVDSIQGLRAWITDRIWVEDFDRVTLARGRSYADGGMISSVVFRESPIQGEILIKAKSEGSGMRIYSVSVWVSKVGRKIVADMDCSCPVGWRCKHSAALMSVLAAEMTNTPVRNGAESVMPWELKRWIEQIESSAVAKPASPPKKPANKDFLAFCIEQQAPGKFVFIMRKATYGKQDERLRIFNSESRADPSRPPSYMVNEDFEIAGLYRKRHRKHGGWGGMDLEGPDWEDLINAAMASGRVFLESAVQENSYRRATYSEDYVPLKPGAPVRARAVWEADTKGKSRPVVVPENPDVIVIPTDPLRYMNPASGEFGLLESDLPSAVLAAWPKGPEVGTEHLAAVTSRFGKFTSAALPVPQEMKTERRKPCMPVPHLMIAPYEIGLDWDKSRIVAGRVFFRYDDSGLLPPLTQSGNGEHAELKGGVRTIWKRNRNAEREFIADLQSLYLTPLAEVMPQLSRFSDTNLLYFPEDPYPTPQMAWMEILECDEIEEMKDRGWVVDVSAGAGLNVHEVGDFFPAIEAETDHGIDWFKFDIAYELDGQKVSLVPVIATAISMGLPSGDSPDLPDFYDIPCEDPTQGVIRFPARPLAELVDHVRHLFLGYTGDGEIRMDRIAAAGVADALEIDGSETLRALAKLGQNLRNIDSMPVAEMPAGVNAELREYQKEGYSWLQFLSSNSLNGILADDMGLGKTLQTLTYLAAAHGAKPGRPSLVIAPTSVVPNWAAEAEKFTPHLKILMLHGKDRAADFPKINGSDIVLTSYPLLSRDIDELVNVDWYSVILDEAQYIKNPKAIVAKNAFKLKAAHRFCLSGTPMENHLGELWSLMRFLMPGFLSDEKTFNAKIRRPIERERSSETQKALNRRVSPLILRRTKDQVASDLPAKTVIVHHIGLTKKQRDLYESVRAAMDKRVRDAIEAKGLAKSHIIVLDALLKLRQICCHPQLLKLPAAKKVQESAKLDFLTGELLPTLLDEGRRILLFSSFTSMLSLIEEHLQKAGIGFLKITGQTKDRGTLVKRFQTGEVPVFLISLKAGGTGLNLTAADTVIHYDPWWNPAAENQATDRAHRIGQEKPVFVHKLICEGSIEERIIELQKHKSGLVEALLSEETGKLKMDSETLANLLAPMA